jgi:hypothetical protein
MPAPQSLYEGLAKAVKDHLTSTYGEAHAGDRLPQMAGLMLVKLGLVMLKKAGFTEEQCSGGIDTLMEDWHRWE